VSATRKVVNVMDYWTEDAETERVIMRPWHFIKRGSTWQVSDLEGLGDDRMWNWNDIYSTAQTYETWSLLRSF
jgi:hypothetical protein